MKNIKLKILAGVLSLLIVFIISGIFYASKQIKKDNIRAAIVEKLKATFPNAHVELGELELSLGTSIKLNAKTFNLTLKEPLLTKNNLFSVNDLYVKIPVWAILFGAGSLDVKIMSPKVSYVETSNINNWDKAMGKAPSKEKIKPHSYKKSSRSDKQEVIHKSEARSTSLPFFITNAKLNILLEDVNVHYRLKNKIAGKLNLMRIGLKDFNINSRSVFDLVSKIEQLDEKNRKTSMEIVAVGNISIANLANGIIEGKTNLKIKNIVHPKLKRELSLVNLDADLSKENGNQKAKVEINISELGALSFILNKKENSQQIKKLNASFSIAEIVNHIDLMGLDLSPGNSRFLIQGSMTLEKDKIFPNLAFELTPGLSFNLDKSILMTSQFKGYIRKTNLSLDSMSKVLNGNINTKIRADIDLNQKIMTIDKMGPFNISVVAQGLDLTEKFIQSKLYGELFKIKKKRSASSSTMPGTSVRKKSEQETTVVSVPILPHSKVDIRWNGIKLGKSIFEGRGIIKSYNNIISTEKISFKFGMGSGDFNFKTKLLKSSATDSNFGFSFTKINLEAFKAFLPPALINNIGGICSGSVSGTTRLSIKDPVQFNVAVNFNSKNGFVKGLNFTDSIQDIANGVPILKDKINKKDLKISKKYEKFDLKGNFKQNHYELSKIHYLAERNSADIIGTGNIYPVSKTQEGQIDLSLKVEKLRKQLEKNVGTNTIPVRLKGVRMALKPDYEYTIGKLARKAVKSKGKKLIKKEVDKLLKSKDVKKLLKGLL